MRQLEIQGITTQCLIKVREQYNYMWNKLNKMNKVQKSYYNLKIKVKHQENKQLIRKAKYCRWVQS